MLLGQRAPRSVPIAARAAHAVSLLLIAQNHELACAAHKHRRGENKEDASQPFAVLPLACDLEHAILPVLIVPKADGGRRLAQEKG